MLFKFSHTQRKMIIGCFLYKKEIKVTFMIIIRLTYRFVTTLNLNWILEFNCLLSHPNFFFFCCSFFDSFHGYTFHIIYSQTNQNYIFSIYSFNCYTSLAFLNLKPLMSYYYFKKLHQIWCIWRVCWVCMKLVRDPHFL